MKIRVGVIFGGESVEHEVSVISASQAIAALDREKYEIIPLYISKSRELYTGEVLFDLTQYKNLTTLCQKATQVMLVRKENQVWVEPVKRGLFTKAITVLDLIVPVVHGTHVEDGCVQGYLEMLKIPYCGCDVTAAAIGQDKAIMKMILQSAGIAMAPWLWIYGHEAEQNREQILQDVAKLGYPVILKPANLGSSVGITIVHNEEELFEGIREASQYDFKVVVEKMVTNLKEINCSVLGDCFKAETSVTEEVSKNDEILSFKDKYQGNSKTKGAKSDSSAQASKGMAGASRIVPANITPEQTAKIEKMALKTFKTLNASGVCRIDFLMDEDSGEIYVNEINTIPGSLAFYLWQPKGVSFSQLMDRLIQISIDRQRRQEKMIFSYDTNLLETYSANGAKGSKGAKCA